MTNSEILQVNLETLTELLREDNKGIDQTRISKEERQQIIQHIGRCTEELRILVDKLEVKNA